LHRLRSSVVRHPSSHPSRRRAQAVAVALSPFLSDSATELAAVTNPLVEREWLTGDELTEAGEG